MKILVTGGVRSGKSRHAESLMSDFGAVTYVAPGQMPNPSDDPDWAHRVRSHQERRPANWNTIETVHLDTALNQAAGPVLIDCLGTWVTALIDRLDGWGRPVSHWRTEFDARVAEALTQLSGYDDHVVTVTNEVGWSVVPEHVSGRVFRDLLGAVNQQWAALSDEVHLVVAGRVIRL